jgi:hypothetical protein
MRLSLQCLRAFSLHAVHSEVDEDDPRQPLPCLPHRPQVAAFGKIFADSIIPVQCLLDSIKALATAGLKSASDKNRQRAQTFLLACLLGSARGLYRDADVPAACLRVLMCAGNDVAHMRKLFFRGSSLKAAEQLSTFQCYANSLQRCTLLVTNPASVQIEVAMFDCLVGSDILLRASFPCLLCQLRHASRAGFLAPSVILSASQQRFFRIHPATA